MPPYAELHCVSNFSFLRGASHPGELVREAARLGYSALALTDECSLAGIVRAWEAAKEVKLPLIAGSEFCVIPSAGVIPSGARDLLPNGIPRRYAPRDDTALTLVLLAEDHEGYSEICRLITLGRRRAEKGAYSLSREDFAGGARGCQLLWVPGAVPAESDAGWIRECFGDRAHIAVELHRHGDDAQRLERLHALSWRSHLPLVAAGSVHMHARERRMLQDTLTAVRHGCTLADAGYRLFPNGERHLRPLEVLRRIYPPALLEQSARLASRCRFTLDQLRYEYPHELVPDGHSASSWLRMLTEQGMQKRWPEGVKPEVRALVEKELVLIAQLRYEHFFLTVQDIVAYARSRGILCQGRGSAANSAVCYCLGVTEVDPARMNLLFERFVSAERNEPPDIDVDFEHERREEVIQYVYAKYGRHRAALAATVICYRPRSAIRDVGKTLGFSLEQVDKLAKSVAWWDAPDALAQRLARNGLDPESQSVQWLLKLVHELVGFPRHLSQHVGGFVISDRPLSELVPIENAAMAERTVIQWDKDDLESLGLLKVDCLALGMLSAIRRTLGLIGEFRGQPMAMSDIPAEDPATYDMIGRGETTGAFQIESRAQMSMLPRLRPRNFYDLVIEVAIIRPGPIQGGMVHPYLRRRQGLEQVEYPSEALRKVLERTLGVPLFQEQVMQIAMVAAGFTPGEADQVRRSMAAWKRHGGLEHFHDRLMQGMAERGYPRDFADRIYQQILGFGSYGFPESHAGSFALLTYVSCWLKCHEPAAFLAGLLNAQPMGFYAPAQLVNEARRAGVQLRPADVLHSDWDCTLEPECHSEEPFGFAQGRLRDEESLQGIPRFARDDTRPAVRLGLRMIARLPQAEAQRIVDLRKTGAALADLGELAHRARLSRRALDALADAGALRGLAGHRHGARWAANGVEALPGLLAGTAAPEKPLALPEPAEGQEILADYRSLGLTLGRHPLALLRERLTREHILAASELRAVPSGQHVKVAGIVTHRQRPETASGVVFATLEDETGTANLIIWPKVMERQLEAVLGASLMLVEGELQSEQGVIHVIAQTIRDCSGWLGGLRAPSRDFH
jgi:error-prone DNA polymerase